jgi:hypothetical protein
MFSQRITHCDNKIAEVIATYRGRQAVGPEIVRSSADTDARPYLVKSSRKGSSKRPRPRWFYSFLGGEQPFAEWDVGRNRASRSSASHKAERTAK